MEPVACRASATRARRAKSADGLRVQLCSTVLRKDEDGRTYLVTAMEKSAACQRVVTASSQAFEGLELRGAAVAVDEPEQRLPAQSGPLRDLAPAQADLLETSYQRLESIRW